MEKEASYSVDIAKLFSDLNSLEQLSQDWPEQYKLGIDAQVKAIEDINKEAFTRIIRFLKSIPEMNDHLKAMVKDDLIFNVLRRYEILKPTLHERIEQSLDSIRPMLQGHGGNIEFIGFEDGVVKVNFTGACDGCPASAVTFYEGVKKTLLEDIPEIKDIKQVKKTNIHTPSRQDDSIRSPFMSGEQWEVILRADEILDKQTLFLNYKQHRLILHRSDEKVTCFENLCAHLGLSLNEGSIQEDIITCPHHGFQYSLLSGECLTAPEIQLSTKKVRIHQGNIELSLSKNNNVIGSWANSSNSQQQQSLLPPIHSSQAQVIIGWNEQDIFASVTPTPSSLFGPRGVLLHPNGSFWVCDTGHHRLLGWHQFPSKDNVPADIVIGQQDFYHEGRNGKGEISLCSLNVPTGIAAYKDGLAVADAWNHRVLIWKTLPERNQQPADLVLGYEKPIASSPNRNVDAITLYWPYGVAEIDGKLLVADTGNRRVLIWNSVSASQQPADLVLGQDSFFTRDENAGKKISDVGMCWPHGISVWKNKLLVSDPGNNRIMVWNSFPDDSGLPCDEVLGQIDCVHGDHNQGQYYPNRSCLNMPYAIAANQKLLWVNDTANSRILIWDELHNKSATYLLGQADFGSKGDNQWKSANRASLCWPYGISVSDNKLAVADSGNNRVMIWDLVQ